MENDIKKVSSSQPPEAKLARNGKINNSPTLDPKMGDDEKAEQAEPEFWPTGILAGIVIKDHDEVEAYEGSQC